MISIIPNLDMPGRPPAKSKDRYRIPTVPGKSPTSIVPYGDLIGASRGDSIVTTDASGNMTGVTVPAQQTITRNPTSEPAAPADPNNPGGFRETPGYQFRFDEGQRALDNSLVSRGLGLSGRAAKESIRYGQDYGSGEYQNVFNRRASIAGITPPVVSNLNALGANYAGNVGNAYMNAGNAAGSAYMQGAQSLNNAAQGGLSNYLFYQYMQPQGFSAQGTP